ncbi:hypothetical protein D9619_002331 [Psilocybe cf. subviscida]|uniref:Extracellular metalloproteinase n=1 Tax=Psilocybe cf. subviscida TaxID=2480587 RepID=A0A8H5AX83_9AGAR|nr:hypothetical protein D9619_002331 [Psilocybe cf. subviscida]
MVTSKFLSSVILAVAYASVSNGLVQDRAVPNHSTHRTRHISRDLKLEAYHPESTYETFGQGIAPPAHLSACSPSAHGLNNTALAFVQSKLGLGADSVSYRSGYTVDASGESYAYGDNVVSFGSSFVKPKSFSPTRPTVAASSVIAKVEAAFDANYNQWPTSVHYLAQADGSAKLVHSIQMQNKEVNSWYEVYVDAHSGDILSVTDFVAEAAYRVLPITKRTLSEGVELLTDPQDLKAVNTTDTSGNNVVSCKSSTTGTVSQSSSPLVFDYTHNPANAPTATANLAAAKVNAFYIISSVHDLAYRYGFTEAAYNFQQDNFGKGGKAGDRVKISVQDSSGTNNANFATPADGQSGTCRMYIWTLTTPNRDGSLENDIVTTEAGGMGEGWSDAMAEWTEQKSATIADYVLGDYVTNKAAGIRNYPYSTSATTNPLRYSSVKSLNEVHNIGEVWANILHQVYAALVNKYGFSDTARTNPDGTEGNIVYMHLFLDALRLQPCNPTMVTARDAWTQADVNRYGGVNKCLLWTAFASRGLGTAAKSYVDSSALPSGC